MPFEIKPGYGGVINAETGVGLALSTVGLDDSVRKAIVFSGLDESEFLVGVRQNDGREDLVIEASCQAIKNAALKLAPKIGFERHVVESEIIKGLRFTVEARPIAQKTVLQLID